ncbi:MAG TPA: twin-arginine translocase TatA/TatE family subunit [Thiothrix sp.]|nr:twin-arginine translocase TatA/TatE family subunit [Thiothrix sp.]
MLSGISPWSLLLILVIVLVLFGTKRLRNAGGDLGSAIKNFKKSMAESSEATTAEAEKKKVAQDEPRIIDSEAKVKTQDKV